jgi:hypothetical protein
MMRFGFSGGRGRITCRRVGGAIRSDCPHSEPRKAAGGRYECQDAHILDLLIC